MHCPYEHAQEQSCLVKGQSKNLSFALPDVALSRVPAGLISSNIAVEESAVLKHLWKNPLQH